MNRAAIREHLEDSKADDSLLDNGTEPFTPRKTVHDYVPIAVEATSRLSLFRLEPRKKLGEMVGSRGFNIDH
jgi:hypothetical protein